MSVDELLPYLKEHQARLVQELRDGKYKPNPVRRVEKHCANQEINSRSWVHNRDRLFII